MDNKLTKKLAGIYLQKFEASRVLPSLQIEYEDVGFWHGLWLKVTRQSKPIKMPPFPQSGGDTITFRRPSEYNPTKD
jgi:hypothetical protein